MLNEQAWHHFYFPFHLFSILRWRHWLRYSSCRMEQNITKCICKQAKSWLTKQNLLIQWFEALDRNFCQQCRLRDTKKNEICRWNGFDVSHEKHFVDRLDHCEKNVRFLNAQVVSLWQNTYSSCCFCAFAIYSIGPAFSHTKCLGMHRNSVKTTLRKLHTDPVWWLWCSAVSFFKCLLMSSQIPYVIFLY